MDYELFQVSAVKAFGHCRDIKAMVSDMQQVLSAVPGLVRKNERLDREKAELDDWKGNAEGFEPDAYMRLPLDADGVPIRIGDEMNIDGDAMTVLGYRLRNDMLLLVVEDKKMGLFFATEPSRVRHFKPEPADSWEKLEEDAKESACRYFGRFLDGPLITCSTCPISKRAAGRTCAQHMQIELVERAKRLAGIKEQEGGERTAIADKKGER